MAKQNKLYKNKLKNFELKLKKSSERLEQSFSRMRHVDTTAVRPTHAQGIVLADMHLGGASISGLAPASRGADAVTLAEMTALVRPGTLNWVEQYRAGATVSERRYQLGDTRFNYDNGGVEYFDGAVWIDLTDANTTTIGDRPNLGV